MANADDRKRGARPPFIPLLDRATARFGRPFRWRLGDRLVVVQLTMVAMSVVFHALVLLADGWPFFEAGISQRALIAVERGSVLTLCGWVALFFATTIARRRRDSMLLLLSFTAAYYGLTAAGFTYITGPFGSAGAFAVLGGVLLGLLLFPRRVVTLGVLVFIAGLFGLDALSRFGELPYRELFETSSATRGAAVSSSWVIRHVLVTLFLGGSIVVVFSALVQSWRYRQRQLSHASKLDALTGLLNRSELMRRFENRLVQAEYSGRPLSVGLVDVDHFKRINDEYGHVVGDRVLREVAARLRLCLRDSDLLGRFGGEEFLFVLRDSSLPGALRTAERCRQVVSQIRFPEAPELEVTISIGVASRPQDGRLAAELIEASDRAMYAAKHRGRNCVLAGDARVVPLRREL